MPAFGISTGARIADAVEAVETGINRHREREQFRQQQALNEERLRSAAQLREQRAELHPLQVEQARAQGTYTDELTRRQQMANDVTEAGLDDAKRLEALTKQVAIREQEGKDLSNSLQYLDDYEAMARQAFRTARINRSGFVDWVNTDDSFYEGDNVAGFELDTNERGGEVLTLYDVDNNVLDTFDLSELQDLTREQRQKINETGETIDLYRDRGVTMGGIPYSTLSQRGTSGGGGGGGTSGEGKPASLSSRTGRDREALKILDEKFKDYNVANRKSKGGSGHKIGAAERAFIRENMAYDVGQDIEGRHSANELVHRNFNHDALLDAHNEAFGLGFTMNSIRALAERYNTDELTILKRLRDEVVAKGVWGN